MHSGPTMSMCGTWATGALLIDHIQGLGATAFQLAPNNYSGEVGC